MRQHSHGFTLIELLVVITIIVVLLALLTPAADKAIRLAEQARCAANLHALGLANSYYRQDNRKKFPTASGISGPVFNVIYSGPGNDAVSSYATWGGKMGTEYTYPIRLINPYVGIQRAVSVGDDEGVFRVFRCPSDDGTSPAPGSAFSSNRKPTTFDCWGSSYFYNSTGNNNDASGLWNKTDVRSPSRCVNVNDWSFNSWFIRPQNTPGVPFDYTFWHSLTEGELGWGNVLLVDSHVDFLQAMPDEPDHQTGPGYTFLPDR